MHEDFDKLGIMRPDLEPRATEYIPQMLKLIESLVEKGYAYLANNGDVYYVVRKFASYGKLSGKTLDSLRAGERVEVDTNKQDPLDFVLWKASKPGEPFWESKFGNGRPGWHIECSAMSEELLGKNFDIHGGGQDLQFPHHENEIAQSEAHNGCKFANYWMHNGFLNINDEKMSKSLGNFFTLRDVLNKYDAEVIRFFMLRTHYRSPLNFSQDGLTDAKQGLTRLYTAIKPYTINKQSRINWNLEYAKRFKQAMDDDFNTSLAISILFEIASVINKEQNRELAELLLLLSNTIGLMGREVKDFFNSSSEIAPELIEEQIKKRQLAKQNRDFATADKIRNDLLAQGIILEDKSTGTIWRNS
jgi:cysteinyl-tRNA synthetase